MSTSSPRPRVVVVGGGVLGVSAAAHLVREGADVQLVTDGALASGASGRSLSWLNSFGNLRSAEYHGLRMAGIDRYRTLAARLGSTPYLRFDGGLTWPAPGATGQMRDHHRHMTEIGYDSVWLAPGEVAGWTPGIDSAAINVARRLLRNIRRISTLIRPPITIASRTLAIAVWTNNPWS